jgi:hypothetical protein
VDLATRVSKAEKTELIQLFRSGANISDRAAQAAADAIVQGAIIAGTERGDGSPELSTLDFKKIRRVVLEMALAEAKRWRVTIRNVEDRNRAVAKAATFHPAHHRLAVIRIESPRSNHPIRQNFLGRMPNLESLELVSGWEDWDDFKRLPGPMTHLSGLRKCTWHP